MKKFLFYGLTALFITNSSFAQTQNVTLGQSNQINIAISNTSNTAKCHIEVTLPNQQKVGVDVDAPQFNAVVDFTPDQIGNSVLKWEGKIKRRGLNSVLGCTGSGSIQVTVIGNSEFLSQQWNQYFAKAPEVIAECVKVGMDLSQLKYQSLSDPNTLLTGPDDQKLKPIYDKCDAFAKQTQPKKGTPCTIPNQNNLKTTCDGVYAERQTDGRLKSISRSTAIQLQFEGKPWTIGLAESLDVRTTRLKQEEEEKIKQGAIIASQKEIEEKERKLKESPEYKKQQAELERKRITDEREASLLKAKREQEAELKTKKNFLLGLCEIPHKSSLSDCSLDAIARMDGTVGSFSIFQEDKLSFIVRSSNKLPANLAVNQDFNVPIKYEIDDKSNRITTIVTNTTGNCLTRTNYEFRNDKMIIVSKGSLSQGCGDYERAFWNRTEPAFEMKFRRIK